MHWTKKGLSESWMLISVAKYSLLFVQRKEVLRLVLNNENIQVPIKWLTSIANTPSMKMVQSRLTGRITTICYYGQCPIPKIPATTAFPGRAIVYKRQLPSSLLPVESFCLNSNKMDRITKKLKTEIYAKI